MLPPPTPALVWNEAIMFNTPAGPLTRRGPSRDPEHRHFTFFCTTRAGRAVGAVVRGRGRRPHEPVRRPNLSREGRHSAPPTPLQAGPVRFQAPPRPAAAFRACAVLRPRGALTLLSSPAPLDRGGGTLVPVKRIHVTTGSSVRGEEEGGRKEEGARRAVKWRLSEWEIQLQRLQPRSPAAKAPPTSGRGRPLRPSRPRPSAPPPPPSPLLRSAARSPPPRPSARRGPRPPFPAGSPLARLRSGPPSASPFPSPSLLPPSHLPGPLPHCPLPQFSIPFPPGLGGPRPSLTRLGPQPPRSRRCHSPPMWAPAGCPRLSPSSRFRWAFPSLGVAF